MSIIIAALFLSAQATSAPSPVSAAPTAAPAVLNGDTPIETILADPAGKAVIDKDMPSLQTNPAFEQIKAMSLRQIQPYSGGAITDELIAKVEADLIAAKKAK